jgi:hypothetical protein
MNANCTLDVSSSLQTPAVPLLVLADDFEQNLTMTSVNEGAKIWIIADWCDCRYLSDIAFNP